MIKTLLKNTKRDSLFPKVRGKITFNEDLSKFSWFRVGGNAEVFFIPADEDDLMQFLSNLNSDIAVTVIGGTSNLLIRDGGIPGVVNRLGTSFNKLLIDKEEVIIGASARDMIVAKSLAKKGVSGLEFLAGIPGTIGGALAMNAGAYGSEISDYVTSISAVDRLGKKTIIKEKELIMEYRKINVSQELIFTSAKFNGLNYSEKNPFLLIKKITQERRNTQPINTSTGGSTFKNPPNRKAWKLIEQAGCRGLSLGGASVSDMHCNFIVNKNNATAKDIEELGNKIKERVFSSSGVKLCWEIKIIGVNKTEVNTYD